MNWLLKSNNQVEISKPTFKDKLGKISPMILLGIFLALSTPVNAWNKDIKSTPETNWQWSTQDPIGESKDVLSEQVKSSAEILALLSSITWKKISIWNTFITYISWNDLNESKVTKKEVYEWYNKYIEIRETIAPELERKLKLVLHTSLISILENWGIEVKWAKELDTVIKMLDLLSGKRTLCDKAIEPEFTKTITVTIKNGKIFEKWMSIIWSTNEWTIHINLNDLYWTYSNMCPASQTNAMNEIVSINGKYIKEEEKNRQANNKIEDLEFKLEELKKEIETIKNEKINGEKKAIEDAKTAKNNAESNLKDELKKLQDAHNLEITNLNNAKSALQKQFDEAKAKAIEDAKTAKNNAESNLKDELKKLQDAHNLEKARLEQEKKNLGELIDIKNNTVDQQKDWLKKTLTELNNQIIKLQNEITLLENSDKKKDEDITKKQAKIDELTKNIQELEKSILAQWNNNWKEDIKWWKKITVVETNSGNQKDKEISILKAQNEELKRQIQLNQAEYEKQIAKYKVEDVLGKK